MAETAKRPHTAARANSSRCLRYSHSRRHRISPRIRYSRRSLPFLLRPDASYLVCPPTTLLRPSWLNRPPSHCPLLILANDSSLLVAPSLRPVLQAFQTAGADIFGITANADGIYHLQSYFLIIAPQVYNTSEFAAYLNAVRPEKDGLTVAARYEVPFTAYFAGLGFTSAAYIPYEKLSWLPLNDKNCYPLTLLGKYHPRS